MNISRVDRANLNMGHVQLSSDILYGFEALSTWMAPWLKVFSFFEELPVPGQLNPVLGPNDVEIPGHPKFPVHAHHLSISQFSSRTSVTYLHVVASLKSICQSTSLRPGPHEMGRSKHRSESGLLSSSLSRLHEGLRDIPEAAAGTCRWILDSAPSLSWPQKGSGTLWVHGKAGSGKSTLLRYVAQDFLSRPTFFGLQSTVSFYFFSFGRGEVRNTWVDVYNFFLDRFASSQRVTERDSGDGSPRSHRIRSAEARPTKDYLLLDQLDEALDAVRNALLPETIVLFIDSLDEYEESDTVNRLIWAVLSKLPALFSLRVFISSRLQPQPPQVSQIMLEDNNTTDIECYCCSKLMTEDVPYRHLLAREIASKSDGVFLWAKLMVSQLGHLHSRVNVGRPLLPSSSSEALRWTMDRVLKNGKNPNLSKTLLQWAMFAQRPLSTSEIQHALGAKSFLCSRVCEECSNGREDTKPCFLKQDELDYRHVIVGIELLTWGLLEVVDGTVRFIHCSVREYLFQRIAVQTWADKSHQILALTCLDYLRATISDLGDALEEG
ncbi:hypothetical protein GGR52DRAFT_69373 [Hypoxylon sp. FL1284]|nr:hypothetical protein GGR52DRAFT_69373 [Hypoxylon sp. FL1284]